MLLFSACFALCIPLLSAAARAADAAITVRAFHASTIVPHRGAHVYVDGLLAGNTGASGAVTLALAPGRHRIAAMIPLRAGAGRDLVVAGGVPQSIDLVMGGESLNEVLPHTMRLDDYPLLPSTATGMRAQFLGGGGAAITLTDLLSVSIKKQDRSSTNLNQIFEIVDGNVVRTRAGADLGAILTPNGNQTLAIEALTAQGATVFGERTFRIGRFAVAGSIMAPASRPTLSRVGVLVELEMIGHGHVFTATSDALGAFALPKLAIGNYVARASRVVGGITYSSAGVIFVTADSQLQMTLLGPADWIAGVSPIEFNTVGASPAQAAAGVAAQAPDAERAARAPRPLPPMPGASAHNRSNLDGTSADTTITAGAGTQNVRYSSQARLSVPRGTSAVKLSYVVQTDEYPTYVLQNSIFNDNWDLFVIGPTGEQLFAIARGVNSQVSLEPVWLPTGATASKVEIFDTARLTADHGVQLILVGTATNIGDSILPTVVQARLSLASASFETAIVGQYTNTNDRLGRFVSIPRPGLRNTFHKGFDLEILAPASARTTGIANTKVELFLGADATTGVTVFDGPPQRLSAWKYRVPTTFSGSNPLASSVSGVPPPAHNIRYRITTRATVDGTAKTSEAWSPLAAALWQLPDGFGHFSHAEPGGDHWISKGGYEWMSTNRLLLGVPIGNIAGEHGQDIGPVAHRAGLDLDIFHFGVRLAETGHGNYAALQALADSAATSATARTQLRNWVSAQRAGLTDLANLASVARIFTVHGAPTRVLPARWAWSMLRDGQFTTRAGKLVSLSLGAAILSPKIMAHAGTNDHHHVVLEDKELSVTP